MGGTVGGIVGDALTSAVAIKPTYGDWEDKVKGDIGDAIVSGIVDAVTRGDD